jgi:hypothetical protein
VFMTVVANQRPNEGASVAGRATRTPTRAKPKIGRPGGMPAISTVAQGGAQRSEQYLEARTGEGARAAARQPAQVLHSGSPPGTGSAACECASGATRASTASPAALERPERVGGRHLG